MKYEKAKAELVSFSNIGFMAFSAGLAAALENAVAAIVGNTCTPFAMTDGGEGFGCGGFKGGKQDVTVTVNGVTYVYKWTNNGHQLSNYHL